MAVILNLIVIVICSIFIFRAKGSVSELLKIISWFFAGIMLSFFLALALQHDYLDGVNHILASAVSCVIFWLIGISRLIFLSLKGKNGQFWQQFIVLSLVLIVPYFIYRILSGASLKIGG
ncbi:MAG: hypothetical protein WC044_09920 [Crocinitomicaceae bacterium]